MPPDNDKSDEDKTISEVGRELLKYLHRRLEDMGMNQASYRQARMELLRQLEAERASKRFNWGFEAVFTAEIHTLEELGLISVKYGSGAIMAGRTSPNQIYNFSLTDDGKDTARVILQREFRDRKDTHRLDDKTAELVDDDDDDQDETDQEPESTQMDRPQGLPGDAGSHDADDDQPPRAE